MGFIFTFFPQLIMLQPYAEPKKNQIFCNQTTPIAQELQCEKWNFDYFEWKCIIKEK